MARRSNHAVAEACSWIGLLVGMYLKYGPEATERGVQLFGPIHGAIFLAYVLVTLLTGRVLRWSPRTTVVALVCSVPPLATAWFERLATRNGKLPRPEPVAAS